jgi:hypothetical protein
VRAVWKYELSSPVLTGIMMPRGAEVLSVMVQGSTPCIWALVDPEAEAEQRTFLTVGTGHSHVEDKTWRHVGSYVLFDGAFVGHVFEVRS